MDKRHPVRKILTALVEFNARVLGRKTPVVRSYTLGLESLPSDFDGVRIAQLSDLHSRSFGPRQRNLLKTLAAVKPDYIFITGDLLELEYGEKERPEICAMLRGASEIAPAFFCLGNHETRSDADILAKELADVKAAGIPILDGTVTELVRGDSRVTLGGVWVKPECPLTEFKAFYDDRELRSFASVRTAAEKLGNPFFILLAHRPECPEMYRRIGADLVYSGHDHGGLMPWRGGGLIAPGQGWFAKRVKGVFKDGRMITVISAGLGGPRICIPPEITVTELRKVIHKGKTA